MVDRDAITLKENLENCTMEVVRELELTSIPVEIVDPQLARVVQWARKVLLLQCVFILF